MTDIFFFITSCVLLLITPGPTNTLLAVSGAVAGIKRSLPLLVAESSGYMVSISILLFLVKPFVELHPSLAFALRVIAAVYLIWAAICLWREGSTQSSSQIAVPFKRMFFATMLNPKALVFAFAILPSHPGVAPLDIIPYLAALCGVIVISIGFCWIGLGAIIGLQSERIEGNAVFRKIGAVVLTGFAIVLLISVVRGIG